MPAYAIIGGNRYVGRRVVEKLIETGADITLVNRGKTLDSFGNRVKRKKADASKARELSEALKGNFDAILHQVAFTKSESESLIKSLENLGTRVVVTSSIAVYNFAQCTAPFREGDMSLRNIKECDIREDYLASPFLNQYATGKMKMEHAIMNSKLENIAIPRLGHVLGHDDPTERFQFMVRKAHLYNTNTMQGKYFTSFITADSAAEKLVELLRSDYIGPINIADSVMSLNEIMSLLKMNRLPSDRNNITDDEQWPFVYEHDYYMDTTVQDSLLQTRSMFRNRIARETMMVCKQLKSK